VPAPCFATLALLALAPSPAPRQTDVSYCRATNARYNITLTPKSGYDFVPIVDDDSLGFYVAYSAKQNETNTEIAGTSCMYVLPLVGDEVLVFGGGYGDTYTIPGGAFYDADYDVAFIRDAVVECMGRDVASTRIRFVAPHGHPDHITVAFIRALERAGFTMAEIAYHEGDRGWIESLPWSGHHTAIFRVLSGTQCAQELLTYDSPLGKVWFVPRPVHTAGSIDLVLDVLGDGSDRVLVLGSAPGGWCGQPSGVKLTLQAHGTALVGGPRRAEAEVVAGSGVNRGCFTALKPPKLGYEFIAEIEISQHAGASSVYVFGTDVPLEPGRMTPFGELLVNPLGRLQLSVLAPVVSDGAETVSILIPKDPTLMGRTCYAQATIFGGGVEMCNALRMVIGF
jgi:hypothetical protein